MAPVKYSSQLQASTWTGSKRNADWNYILRAMPIRETDYITRPLFYHPITIKILSQDWGTGLFFFSSTMYENLPYAHNKLNITKYLKLGGKRVIRRPRRWFLNIYSWGNMEILLIWRETWKLPKLLFIFLRHPISPIASQNSLQTHLNLAQCYTLFNLSDHLHNCL